MNKSLQRLDELAAISVDHNAARILERVVFIFLVILVLAAPHSIAASQTAWLIGLTAWIIRSFIKPRPKFTFGKLDLVLLAFIAWSVISAFSSYEPAVSIDKLRSVGIFLAIYYVLNNLRSLRSIRFVVLALIVSCMVNVVWTPIERIIGRGVEVHGVTASSALASAGMLNGDTILKVNGKKVSTPADIMAFASDSGDIKVVYYRPDAEKTVTIKRSDIVIAAEVETAFGFETWKKNHKWRAKGFYGHFTTYSEVLQIVGSLLLGLFGAMFLAWYRSSNNSGAHETKVRPAFLAILAVSFGLLSLALLLSGTRASQLGLLVSGFVMALAAGSRKFVIAMVIAAIPVCAIGYYVLQQTRQQDENSNYRKTMWSDGVRLATEKPRHLIVGVGMDSIKKRWPEWDLFGGGYLPMGHFHSTPLQLAVERGMPALVLWLMFLAILFRTFWRAARTAKDTFAHGVLLGCIGSLAGFFTAGIVHYNLGDGEVAMVFYIMAGIGLAAVKLVNTSTYSEAKIASEV